jgi:hypothetical protein
MNALTPNAICREQSDITMQSFCFNTSTLNKGRIHGISINRPTKRGKEKSPFDGHCQCEKEMGDHLLACQSFLKRNHEVTSLAHEQASLLKNKDINVISFFGTSDFC